MWWSIRVADIRVEGLSALQKALQTLPDKLERNIVRSALRAGLREMQKEAQARVPVQSGALRESLKIKTKVVEGAPVAALAAGGPKAFYAKFVEFGTGGQYTGSGKSGGPYVIKSKNGKPLFINEGRPVYQVTHPGAKAQPFMRPAFDAGNQAALSSFSAYIRKRLTKQGIEIPDGGDE